MGSGSNDTTQLHSSGNRAKTNAVSKKQLFDTGALMTMASQAIKRLNEMTAELVPLDEAFISLVFLLRNPQIQNMVSRTLANFQITNNAGDPEQLWKQLHDAISSFLKSDKALVRLQSDALIHKLSIVWLGLLLLVSASRITRLKLLEDAVHLVSTLMARGLRLSQRFLITRQVVQRVHTEQLLPPSFCKATAVGELFVLMSQVIDHLRMGANNKTGQFASMAMFVSIVARFFETVMNGIMCYVEFVVQGDLENIKREAPDSSPPIMSINERGRNGGGDDDDDGGGTGDGEEGGKSGDDGVGDKKSGQVRKLWKLEQLEKKSETNPLMRLIDTRAIDMMLLNAVGMSSSTLLKYCIAALSQFSKSRNFRSIMRVVGQMLATQSSLTVAVRSLMKQQNSLFSEETSLKWERDNALQLLFELLGRLSAGASQDNVGGSLISTYRGIVTTAAHVLYSRFIRDPSTRNHRRNRHHNTHHRTRHNSSSSSSNNDNNKSHTKDKAESSLHSLLNEVMSEGQ